MIRWATAADRVPLVHLMQAAHMGCSWYGYADMDGLTVVDVDEATQALRGYVRFDLGRPEAHVRQLVVAPAHQGGGLVAKALLARVIELAQANGVQGIEGFVPEGHAEWISQLERAGAYIDRGVRVRWPLTEAAGAEARRWREALRPSGPR